MLFGLNKKPDVGVGAASSFVFDVGAANFEAAVLKASMDKPVVLDFWAPWCRPCRQLMPALEKAVVGRKGKVVLAKVNVDDNPELSQAFRIQSVPTVIVLYKGAPVTGFTGAKPASEIELILDQVLALVAQEQPEDIDPVALMTGAAEALERDDVPSAQNFYALVLQQNPHHAGAYCGMVKLLVMSQDIEGAQGLLDSAPDEVRTDPLYVQTLKMLQMIKVAPQGDLAQIEADVAANPEDYDGWFKLAQMYFARGLKDQAVDALIAIISRNRTWGDEKARKELLSYFDSWGFADGASVQGRKKLSKLLFS